MIFEKEKSVQMGFRVLLSEREIINKMAKDRNMEVSEMIKTLIKKEYLTPSIIKDCIGRKIEQQPMFNQEDNYKQQLAINFPSQLKDTDKRKK